MPNKLNTLFFFGRPFGPLYGFIMKIREQLYRKNIFRQHSTGVPVISVGNLVLGGTGKTPTVIYLAELLCKNGFRPAIVSRGYGGKSQEKINVVSDGNSLLMNTRLAGDEPVLLANSLKNVPVLTGKKRVFPCNYAVQELGVNCLILDDGFQHMAVSRDVNLVLFDAEELAGNSRIFPAGPLREPISALKRTTAFLITGQTPANSKRSEAFADLLRTKFINFPVFTAQNSSVTILQNGSEVQDISKIGKAYLFCAIANPERVTKTLDSLGVPITQSKFMADHKGYSQQIVTELCKEAERFGAQCLVTTSKDFVKIENLNFTMPIFTLQVKQKPEPAFAEFLLNKISPKLCN